MREDARPQTPEETIAALSRQVEEGSITRHELLRQLLKIGLEEQKRWKAIRLVQRGKLDVHEAARIAHLDEESFRQLLK